MAKRLNILHLQIFALVFIFIGGVFSAGMAQESAAGGDDRWKLVEKNSTDEYYYDSLTVTYTGDTVILWIKTVYLEMTKDEDGKQLKSAINSLALFCGKNRYTMKDVEVTYKNGSKKEIDYEEKNKKIKPESLIDKLYNQFCRKEE